MRHPYFLHLHVRYYDLFTLYRVCATGYEMFEAIKILVRSKSAFFALIYRILNNPDREKIQPHSSVVGDMAGYSTLRVRFANRNELFSALLERILFMNSSWERVYASTRICLVFKMHFLAEWNNNNNFYYFTACINVSSNF